MPEDDDMNLFERRKSENLKILSEREIQSKLYGKYRKPHLEESREPSSFKKSLEQPTEDQVLGGADLFSPAAPTKPTALKSEPQIDSRKEKIEKYVQQENKTVQKAGLRPQAAIVSSPKNKNYASGFIRSINSVLSAAKLLFSGLTHTMVKAIAMVLQGIISIADLKNHRNRRLLAWIGAGAAVVAILAGINLLNAQREQAMKNPRRAVVEAPVLHNAENTDSAGAESLEDQLAVTTEAGNEEVVDSLSSAIDSGTETVSTETPEVAVKPYVIQIATYISLADAKKMSQDIINEGFPSFVEGLSRQSGRVYHCVFLGRFKTYSEAESQLAEFKKRAIAKPFQDAFIRSLGSRS